MYRLIASTKFNKDLKKAKKDGKKYTRLREVLKLLANGGVEALPSNMEAHKLKGNFNEKWECHMKPDFLLIWDQLEDPKEIYLVRMGSHSELFG